MVDDPKSLVDVDLAKLEVAYFGNLVLKLTEVQVRERLERLRDLGVLPMYEMADDRGLEMEEYVDLVMRVING